MMWAFILNLSLPEVLDFNKSLRFSVSSTPCWRLGGALLLYFWSDICGLGRCLMSVIAHGHLCFTMKITLVTGYYLMIFWVIKQKSRTSGSDKFKMKAHIIHRQGLNWRKVYISSQQRQFSVSGQDIMMTPEQLEALHYSEEGHNIWITGQCGTGKTFALK
jgi:hypothetical protein